MQIALASYRIRTRCSGHAKVPRSGGFWDGEAGEKSKTRIYEYGRCSSPRALNNVFLLRLRIELDFRGAESLNDAMEALSSEIVIGIDFGTT